MIVYFLRHASAGQSKSDPVKDEKRALDEDGIQQCGYIGRALAALDVHVDIMISSPLKRASQTASLVGNEMGYEGKLVMDRALLPEAAFQAFRELLNRHSKQEAILVVGHNPSMSEFLGKLIGDGAEASIDFKKGAVAKVEVDRKMAALHWCLTPKVVRTLYESAAASSRPKTSRK
jgi:phosphohistidine phosphatase